MSWVFGKIMVTAFSYSITAFLFLYEFLLTFNNFNYTRIQFVGYQKIIIKNSKIGNDRSVKEIQKKQKIHLLCDVNKKKKKNGQTKRQ